MKINTLIKVYKHIGFERIKQFLTYNIPYKEDGAVNEYAGTVDEVEYEALVGLAQKATELCPDGVIVEVGALFGLSTQAILEGSECNKVIAIDNFAWNPIGLTPNRHESMLKSNLKYFSRNGRLEIFKGSSSDYLKDIYSGDKVSMVFIDADHSYEGVLNDINFAEAINALIICGDDYSFPGVRRAVDERFRDSVHRIGDMWFVER
jgi:predicted O-methyltransferase YrrM